MATVARMLIYPENPLKSPDPERVRQLLQEIGLIGEGFEWQGEQRWFAGPGFFNFITFMGCSPAIEFEPADTANMDISSFCHLRLLDAGAPIAVTGLDTVNARCRACGQALAEQQQQLRDWQQDYTCPGCGASVSLPELNWRRSAAFGRFFVEIWSIYPKEAIPVDSLLGKLAGLSDCDWNYAYVREEV